MRSRARSPHTIPCRRCGKPIDLAIVYCWRCLQQVLRTNFSVLTLAPGTPVSRAAGAAVPGASGGSDLYVAVTRKGSLTNETVGTHSGGFRP